MLTNLNPSNPELIARDVASLYIPALIRQKVAIIKEDNVAMTILITQIFKNPSKTNLNNKLIAKEGLSKIQALLNSNYSLLKIFGEVENVVPLESIDKTESKFLIKYKVGKRVALITKNNAGQIVNIISEFY